MPPRTERAMGRGKDKEMRLVRCFTLLWTFAIALPAQSATIPFTEDFTTDSSNWYDQGSTGPLDWVPTGGPDGGSYASGPLDFSPFVVPGDTTSAVRAQDEFGSSGGAFEGNYIAENVLSVSVFVRHNAPVPLSTFARFSPPTNFPGGIAIAFAPVLPNVWTELTFVVTEGSPQLVSFEGSTYPAVFSNVGHVQFGVEVPAPLLGSPTLYTFDIDKVSIAGIPVPEPSTASLLALGVLGACLRGRARG